MRYAWHHVGLQKPPKGVLILGLHSEWHNALLVILRGTRWYWVGPNGERALSADGLSTPLHWARLPVGFSKG